MRLHEITDEIDEASRIGSAVRLDDIPARYKGLPVINRGTTTIALDLSAEEVILITRDSMKVEWLEHIEQATVLGSFERPSHIRGMHDLPIYILKCPKLFPLSLANKRLVRKVCQEFDGLIGRSDYRRNADDRFMALYHHYTKDEQHVLYPLFDFLSNYDHSWYQFDLGPRNVMQTASGELVVSDPIVLSQIVNLIRDRK